MLTRLDDIEREMHDAEVETGRRCGLTSAQVDRYRDACGQVARCLDGPASPSREVLAGDLLIILMVPVPGDANWEQGWYLERVRDHATQMVEERTPLALSFRRMQGAEPGSRVNYRAFLRVGLAGRVRWQRYRELPDDETAHAEPEPVGDDEALTLSVRAWTDDQRRKRFSQELEHDRKRWGTDGDAARQLDAKVVEVFERRLAGERVADACSSVGCSRAQYQRRQKVLCHAVLRHADWRDYATVVSTPGGSKDPLWSGLRKEVERIGGRFKQLRASVIYSGLSEVDRWNNVVYYWSNTVCRAKQVRLPTGISGALRRHAREIAANAPELHLVSVGDEIGLRGARTGSPSDLADPMDLGVRYRLGYDEEAS